MILKSWSRKTGRGVADLKGINVTKSAVEFWFETTDNVSGRVSLHQFHNEGVRSGMEHLAYCRARLQEAGSRGKAVRR